MTRPDDQDAFLAAFAERDARAARRWLRDAAPERDRALRRARLPDDARGGLAVHERRAARARCGFDLPADGAGEVPTEDGARAVPLGAASLDRLVFVNGRFARRALDAAVAAGGRPRRQSRRGADHATPERGAPAPGAARGAERGDAFAALNTAFCADGAFVRVAAGVALEAADPPRVPADRARGGRSRRIRGACSCSGAAAARPLVESYVGAGRRPRTSPTR